MTVVDPYEALKARMAEIRERFERESADGTVTIRKDEGLYRHLECSTALAMNGHSGSYVFTRDDDMLDFFRTTTAGGRLDPIYLARRSLPAASRA
ncbi:hypothetical protein ACFWJT_27685 [Streptomyces sp. NPDC127069]|uniref:hypothetical protein n=1 Tax=Streptomyces sp. NPDC127069 TaxID=3347128 RepID=UPI00366450AB